MEKNYIGTANFDFCAQNEDYIRTLYGRWDSFVARNFVRIADEVLSKYSPDSGIIEIDRIQLELGALYEDEFDEKFPLRLREELEKSLSQYILCPTPERVARVIPENVYAFELLKSFLLHGSLPGGNMSDIHSLFTKTLNESANLFKQFLQTYGHYTSLQQRLVYQFSDSELENAVRLLAPGSDGNFICSYVRFLRDKYRRQENKPEINETNYRHSVWQVVYAYLLSRRSSFFDRKMFVAQTIAQLAAKYNTGYDTILEMLAHELQGFAASSPVPPELFVILEQLYGELSEKRWKSSFADSAGFFRMVCSLLKRNTETNTPPTANTRKALTDILSEVDTCRGFLQQMSEQEIIHLTYMLVPAESPSIVETARSLDEQKDTGVLQGKAGGEFRLLKWQIIFPIVFENRSAGFNRRYFVQSVFKKICNHYNTDMILLLDYFCGNFHTMHWMSRELKEIITDLSQRAKQNEGSLSHGDGKDDTSVEMQYLTEEKPYAPSKDFFPHEGEFIAGYVLHPERLPATGFLQEKADNGFRKLKWRYMSPSPRYMFPSPQYMSPSPQYMSPSPRYMSPSPRYTYPSPQYMSPNLRYVLTVLKGIPENDFNRHNFVSETLRALAAHFNLSYFDLLSYFCSKRESSGLSVHLLRVLDELYRREKTQWVKIALNSVNESGYVELLATLVPSEQQFVETYVRALNFYRPENAIQGKTSGEFTKIKWKFVFETLLEFRRMSFNKKQFVERTLRQMAAHYNLSFREMLEYIAALTDLPAKREFAEINSILRELRSAEIRGKQGRPSHGQGRPSLGQGLPSLGQVLPSHGNLDFQFVNNAGIVLLSPYLPRLFEMLRLTENGGFQNDEAQIRAMFLIQYIVFGATEGWVEFPEPEMRLNKILTGWDVENPIPQGVELNKTETDAVDSMFRGVLSNWDRMRNTSIEGFRLSFLQREGKTEEKDEAFLLTVEEKSYDILLDYCPWGFKTFKYKWMKKMMQTKWR